MGVKGLWRLLMPIGRRISIETLEGKILAVDASIWLTQFLKAMRDPDSGQVRPAAHLIGFFRRLCKLRFQGIRPVFVFDGATPEIKQRELRDRRRRREQFSHEHSEEVIQRLAKRLLVHQLRNKGSKISGAMLKKKNTEVQATTQDHDFDQAVKGDTTTAVGAYAPGFYDPEMDQAPVPSSANGTIELSKEMDSASGREICDVLEDSTDYLGQATSTISHESDWDTLVVEAQVLQESADKASEQERDEEGTNSAPVGNHRSGDPNEFDPAYVASLPATKRKDMVENAQRQRRLQSRREFMKVAYDPDGLSKCQLRNFLKSTKLNQRIHKMAQHASKANGLDNTLASDKAKRIIFETNSDAGNVSREEMRKEQQVRSLGHKRKLSVMSSSGDESDHDLELKGTADRNTHAGFVKPWKTRAFLDDDETDESGGKYSSDIEIEREGTKVNSNTRCNENDCNEGSAGGFIKRQTPSQNSNSLILGSGERAEIPFDGSDSSDGEDRKKLPVDFTGLNGVIPRQSPPQDSKSFNRDTSRGRARIVIHESDSSDDENRKGYTSRNSKSDRTVQELNDEMIARALQEAEYDSDVDGRRVNPSEDSHATEISDRDTLRNRENLAEDDDDITWEDGEGHQDDKTGNQVGKGGWYNHSTNKPDSTPTSADNMAHQHIVVHTFDRDNVKTEQNTSNIAGKVSPAPISQTDVGTVEAFASVAMFQLQEASKPVCPVMVESLEGPTNDDDESEEEFIEWEDGNYDEETPLARKVNNEQAKSAALFPSTEQGSVVNPDDDRDGGETDYQDGDENVDNTEMSFHDAWPEVVQKDSEEKSSEISAALEHAQETAAKLTNWAGRAFRRAVAQHAAENALTITDKDEVKIVHGGRNDHSTSDQNGIFVSNSGIRPIEEKANDRVIDLWKPSLAVTTATTRKPQSLPMAWPEILGDDDILLQLEEYEERWAHERNQLDRDSDTVTDEMRTEAINLLQLFGVPYVEAPAEAEAQCVMLEKLGLVDGIVTEDSDAFVFGGKRIYKNIFDDQRYVEVYDAQDAEKEMNLTRDGLVALAMLLGGDYTEGVKGVGIVNGMEIVQAFDVSRDVKEGLEKFRHWLDGFNPFDSWNVAQGKEEMTKEQIFHRKHHSARTRWVAPKYFPDPKVLSAYMNPVVDNSNEKFSWGIPDMDRLILFFNKHVGWSADETRQLLKPVVDKIETGGSMYQTRIDSFMRYEDGIKFANVLSRRLRAVLNDVKGDSDKMDESRPTKKRKAAGRDHAGSSSR